MCFAIALPELQTVNFVAKAIEFSVIYGHSAAIAWRKLEYLFQKLKGRTNS